MWLHNLVGMFGTEGAAQNGFRQNMWTFKKKKWSSPTSRSCPLMAALLSTSSQGLCFSVNFCLHFYRKFLIAGSLFVWCLVSWHVSKGSCDVCHTGELENRCIEVFSYRIQKVHGLYWIKHIMRSSTPIKFYRHEVYSMIGDAHTMMEHRAMHSTDWQLNFYLSNIIY